MHPKGTVYAARPADASEAEARRAERFEVTAQTPGMMKAPDEPCNASFPMTLDLRWMSGSGKREGKGGVTPTSGVTPTI
jgi:uncharacterized protein (DUF2126 family)